MRIDLVMIDKGIIEINGKRTKVDRQDIQKLKRILDELSIMHIIDGVSFHSTFRMAGRMEYHHDNRMMRAENDVRVLPESRFAQQEQIQFWELKIPNFCLLDFVSLTQLDYDEAEFVGDLVYGSQCCSSVSYLIRHYAQSPYALTQ